MKWISPNYLGWLLLIISVLLILIPNLPIYPIVFTFLLSVGMGILTIKRKMKGQGIGILVGNLIILPFVLLVLWVTFIKFEASVVFSKQKATNHVESISK